MKSKVSSLKGKSMIYLSVWTVEIWQRLGFSQKCIHRTQSRLLCIDHHVSNEAFADVNYIVPDASSTSELVYNLLDYDKMSL